METDVVPVSLEAPFLSNLNVLDNIVLLSDSQEHFTHTSSLEKVKQCLDKVGLQEKALTHHTKLSSKEYFIVQCVRASILEQISILIDSPFFMVSGEKELGFVLEVLKQLGVSFEKVLIVDLRSQVSKYKEELCHIEEC